MSVAVRAWIILAAIACWLITVSFLLGDPLYEWGLDTGGGIGNVAAGFGDALRAIADLLSWLPLAPLIFFAAGCVLTWIAVPKTPK